MMNHKVVWDDVMLEETRRIYPGDVSSTLEDSVRRDIIDWMLDTPIDLSGMDMKDVIKLFWKERLN